MDRAGLAHGQEPGLEPARDRGREGEPTRLDSSDLRHAGIGERLGERLDGALEDVAVGEQPEHVGMAADPAEPSHQLLPKLAARRSLRHGRG